ncbi:hypothetical protein GIB67_042064 [Kingdonia uniflora]|uniref:Uncharacterized protein n=1 Tax=Kingdonia uniflora TaxID=39325 RepID=A0A7J7MVR6_9MAGN|nr:hypothetical protein GIB67_042064 [Kingdonia uniflora]
MVSKRDHLKQTKGKFCGFLTSATVILHCYIEFSYCYSTFGDCYMSFGVCYSDFATATVIFRSTQILGIFVSPLTIYHKRKSTNNDDLEKGDFNDRLTVLESKVSRLSGYLLL